MHWAKSLSGTISAPHFMKLRSTLTPETVSSGLLVWLPARRSLRSVKAIAQANVAVCCLHMEEYRGGPRQY